MSNGTVLRLALATLILNVVHFPLMAQSVSAPRDPQAVTWITKSMSALTGGVEVNDVTIQGTATQTIGSTNDTGAITLNALGERPESV